MKNKCIIPVLLLNLLLVACGGGDGDSTSAVPTVVEYTAFGAAVPISIENYPGLHVMEPFISRDGKYLFFNDMTVIPGPPIRDNKDIYFATYDSSSRTFSYVGAISILNMLSVEGVPTLDDNNRFYYISTFAYPGSLDTVYVGDFDPLSTDIVNNRVVVPDLGENVLGHLNFDIEVSPDGTTLYFVDGDFTGNLGYPGSSNFVYAIDSGTGFERQSDSNAIFANINTRDLEYAACISRDGLEFFFTRLDIATLETTMWRATRPSLTSPFGVPQKIGGLSGFFEAPTLSPDEKTLYFHLRKPGEVKFDLYRMSRP